jgi:hypothetical protein
LFDELKPFILLGIFGLVNVFALFTEFALPMLKVEKALF